MTAVLLHLSDIHIKGTSDPILKNSESIAKALFASLPSATHIFIVVSGDIAFSGNASEYSLAEKFLREIQRNIKKETTVPIDFVIAPGNHDCDFTGQNQTRKFIIESLEKTVDVQTIDTSVVESCTAIQTEFFNFRNRLEKTTDIDDRLWRTQVFELESQKVVFEILNVSWTSKLKEDAGKLVFPIGRYQENKLVNADVRFVVMHHPLNWFSQNTYRQFRTFIRKVGNVIITGHEHHGNVGVVSDAETETSAFVEGCVLQNDKRNLNDSSFNIVAIDLNTSRFSSTRFVWDGDKYSSSEDGSWVDYHDLPEKRTNKFSIAENFEQTLDDPGAFFKHPSGTSVTLSDIYVYPDLRKVGNGEDRRRTYVNANTLLSPETIVDGVLIEGDEKAGCSSLLYNLYRQYHDRGYVPLLIRGKDLRKASEHELDSLIKKNVAEQYGENNIENFMQLSRMQKILLLDDFDDSPLKASNARAGLLCSLRRRFGHFVVTVGDMFEINEMLDGDSSSDLASLVHYKLQPFGHVLREQLISRWLLLGQDGTVDDASQIARLDQAEKLMNAVMQKSIIPAVPLYLLTLLQSMDAGRSGDFKESSQGYYYQYLLTEAFQNSSVKPDKLTEHFQYAAYLAWEFHLLNKRELSITELRLFNDKFSKQWHTVDFGKRLDVLLESRVLCLSGEDYAFRYPYIYYYLKGQYLSENLNALDVRAYIGNCCTHLYVRDHANTILFLAHHTNDDYVLKSISDALHRLFPGKNPVAFSGDTGVVNKLIEDAPKLIFNGESPKTNRNKRNAIQDELDDGHDGMSEREEDSPELSLIAQITTLFKTTEILGQVLKNQYSKIQRSRKAELIEELFNGPLRAIRDFYDYCEKNSEGITLEIEAALSRKGKVQDNEERKDLARKVAANLIQFITYGFIFRASQSANSESLKEDVESIVRKNGSNAFKLIQIGINLDSPKPIPRSGLKALYRDVKTDMVASRVINIMVLSRLYMFKTSEADMQWLNQELKIDLDIQHAITYQENAKRIS